MLAAHKTTNIQRAIKIVDLTVGKTNIEQIEKEISVLTNLRHPNITAIIEYFHKDDKWYIVMELCTGGGVISRYSEKRQIAGKRRGKNY